MSDRFYKDIEIPEIPEGMELSPPSPGFVQLYGKSGKIVWQSSGGTVNTGVSVDDVTTMLANATPEVATTTTLGVIKVGSGLTIDQDGVLGVGNTIYFDEIVITVDQPTTPIAPVGGYTVGKFELYQNGILLVDGNDYTATDGINITLATEIAAEDRLLLRKWYSSNTTIFGTTVLTATAGQTTFTIPSGYTPGSISVSLDGFLLYGNGDGYVATDGTTIVTTFPIDAGSKLCVHRWTTVNGLPPPLLN